MVKSLLFQVNKSRGNSVINSTEVPGLGERKFRMLGEGYFHFRDYCDVSLVSKTCGGTQPRTQENPHIWYWIGPLSKVACVDMVEL